MNTHPSYHFHKQTFLLDGLEKARRRVELSRLNKMLHAARRSLDFATRERQASEPNLRCLHYFTEDAARHAMRLILEASTCRPVNDVARNCLLIIWAALHGPALDGDAEAWDFPCASLGRADTLVAEANLLILQASKVIQRGTPGGGSQRGGMEI